MQSTMHGTRLEIFRSFRKLFERNGNCFGYIKSAPAKPGIKLLSESEKQLPIVVEVVYRPHTDNNEVVFIAA